MEKNGILVLDRKPGERIDIGEGLIVMTVVRVTGNRVKISFSAPKDICIVRSEIVRKKKSEAIAS